MDISKAIQVLSIIVYMGSAITLIYKGNQFFNSKFVEKVNEVVQPQIKCLEEKTDKQFENYIEKNVTDHTLMITGLIAVLMDRIKQFAEYLINRKYATMYDKQIIQSLFSAYKSFGGNSFIPDLIDKVMALPLKPKNTRKRKVEKENG